MKRAAPPWAAQSSDPRPRSPERAPVTLPPNSIDSCVARGPRGQAWLRSHRASREAHVYCHCATGEPPGRPASGLRHHTAAVSTPGPAWEPWPASTGIPAPSGGLCTQGRRKMRRDWKVIPAQALGWGGMSPPSLVGRPCSFRTLLPPSGRPAVRPLWFPCLAFWLYSELRREDRILRICRSFWGS